MHLIVLKINEDGSATCEIDMTNDELIAMAKRGIIDALTEAVKEMKDQEDEN
jgi:hypothetical protein